MIWRAAFIFILPLFAAAQIEITEIMYDPEGSDTNREWLEIQNTGSNSVDLSGWKFFEYDTNHGLTEYQGGMVLTPGVFAVIVKDPPQFIADWPNLNGIIIDSSWSSFSQDGESLAMKNGDVLVDEVVYSSTWGAAGDGNSLQKINGSFVAAAPTPGGVNNSAQQNTNNSTTTQTENAPPPSSQTAGGSAFPVEPQIKTSITGPSVGVVGAEIYFKALTTGLKGEFLPQARNLWSFGDGASAEGGSVIHTYHFPGEYTVVLEAASDKYNVSAHYKIRISEAKVSFKKIKTGSEGFIEIENHGSDNLDISYWQIRSGGFYFIFPKNTIISSKSSVVFPNSVTELEPVPGDTYLLYPSGFVVVRDDIKVIPPPPEKSEPEIVRVSSAPAIVEEVSAGKEETFQVEPEPQNFSVATSSLAAAGVTLNDNSGGTLKWYLMLGAVIVISCAGYFLIVRSPGSLEAKSGGQKYVIIEDENS